MGSPEVEIARQQWQAASRRMDETRGDPRAHERLMAQVEAVTGELRRQLGQTFTLDELVETYRSAEAWALEAIEDADGDPGWEREAALVTDTAFHFYARGASDYAP